MQPTRVLILAVLGAALTIFSGIVYGRLASRWGPNNALANVGNHVSTLPETIRNWRSVASEELADSEIKMLKCSGHTVREYVNSMSGERVKLALIVGPPGPIAVHTPEVCYTATAWSLAQARERCEIGVGKEPTQSHEFWAVTLQSSRATGERIRVYYAWTAGNAWRASESPRYEFAGEQFLVKLQIAGSTPWYPYEDSPDPCHEFLSDLVACGWKVTGNPDSGAYSSEDR